MYDEFFDKYPPFEKKGSSDKSIEAEKAAVFARIAAEQTDTDNASVGGDIAKPAVYKREKSSPLRVILPTAAAVAAIALIVTVSAWYMNTRDLSYESSYSPTNSSTVPYRDIPDIKKLAELSGDDIRALFRDRRQPEKHGALLRDLYEKWGEPADIRSEDGREYYKWKHDATTAAELCFLRDGRLNCVCTERPSDSAWAYITGRSVIMLPTPGEAAAMTSEAATEELRYVTRTQLLVFWGTESVTRELPRQVSWTADDEKGTIVVADFDGNDEVISVSTTGINNTPVEDADISACYDGNDKKGYTDAFKPGVTGSVVFDSDRIEINTDQLNVDLGFDPREEVLADMDGFLGDGYFIEERELFEQGLSRMTPVGDIVCETGTPVTVFAPKDGEVLSCAVGVVGFGNTVLIDCGDGTAYMVSHVEKFLVKPGDTVKAGDRIAVSGTTGNAVKPRISVKIIKWTE